MKFSRKNVRRAGKLANLLVALAMLLQPVGTPGIVAALALADETTPTTTSVTPAVSGTTDNIGTPSDTTSKPADTTAPSDTNATKDTTDSTGTAPTATDPTPSTTITDPVPATNGTNSGDSKSQTNTSNSGSASSNSNSGTNVDNPPASVEATPTAPKQEENGKIDAVVVENVKARTVDLKKIDPENVEQTAKLATDKADYAPTDTAIITGTGFTPGETYNLVISSKDKPPVTKTVQVTADENGQFVYAYQLDGNYRPDYKVESKDSTGNVIASVTFTDANPSADLDQCANGSLASPNNCTSSADWVNGNLGSSKAHYFEGDVVPYRIRMGNISTSGSHTITIEWDTTKSGKHALDYITTFNYTVPADPCAGVSGCSAFSSFSIPSDPQVTGAGVTPIAGNFRLYGGTITAVSAYSYADGTGFTGDKSARITITFTAAQGNPVLAWGGHISDRFDWGVDNSAVAISGSPYHTRLINLDGSGGNQDRSLSADAVIFPGSITIIKQASPEGSTDFPFTASPSPLADFSLVDDGTSANTKLFSNITNFQTYSVTENTPAGWSLSGIRCSVTSSNGGTQTSNGSTETINLKEGENVTCTYSNESQIAHLTLVKTVINNNGGLAAATDWILAGSGPTSISGTTGSSSVKNVAVTAGNYSLSESGGPSGYTASTYSCVKNGGSAVLSNSIALAGSDSATCTINNDDQPATLIVKKIVNNNFGGTKQPQDFSFSVNGGANQSFEADGENDLTVSAGTYNITEPAVAGYSTSYDNCSNVIIPNGGSATCTITNSDIQPKLTVTKIVVGGTAPISDFPLFVDTTQVTSGVQNGFNAGSHTVSETNKPGYSAEIGGDCASDGSITLAPADVKACTITNTRDTGQLKAVKVVDDSSDLTNWSFSLDGGAFQSANSSGLVDFGQVTTLDTHTVVEKGPNTYHFVSISGANCTQYPDDSASATVAKGGTTICTFSNAVNKGSLEIIKNADPKSSQLFNFTTTGSGLSSFSLDDDGNNSDGISNTQDFSNLFPDTYSVTELTPPGWDLNISCSSNMAGFNYAPLNSTTSFSIRAGENVQCTFTNTQRGHLIVNKVTDPSSDTTTNFPITASGTGTITAPASRNITGGSSQNFEVTPGTYSISESVPGGWQKTGDTCQSVAVGAGETKYCTLTNTKLSMINISKVAIGPDGSSTDFNFNASGLTATSFSLNGGYHRQFFSLLPGPYSISEASSSGWDLTSLSCSSNIAGFDSSNVISPSASFNLRAGESVTCTFTNTERGSISGMKFNDVNGNGSKDAGDDGLAGWTIFIDSDNNQQFDVGETSSTTPSSGAYVFQSLVPGSYSVCEDEQNDWQRTQPASSNCQNVTVSAGQNVQNVDFGNFELGSISGQKFNDLDGNGTKDLGEPALDGWTIYLDANDNGQLDPGEQSTTTGAGGNYEFSDLFAGIYHVREVQQSPAWLQTAPAAGKYDITITSGDNETGKDFGNQGQGTIQVLKNVDLDNDGDYTDPGETNVIDWNWNMDGAGNFATGSPAQTVAAGSHTVSEVHKNFFHPVDLVCNGTDYGAVESQSLSVSPGDNIVCTFSNARDFGTVVVEKVTDPTPRTDQFTINLSNAANSIVHTYTLNSDNYPQESFGVPTGGYALAEDLTNNPSWSLTGATCHDGQDPNTFDPTQGLFQVNYRETVFCTFNNEFVVPGLRIEKSNDAPNPMNPGDTVTYTLVVKAKGIAPDGETLTTNTSIVKDVHVTDLPPDGFAYVPGSWTAASSLGGGHIGNLELSSPYHSPGVWDLGDMQPDEVITLTYETTISAYQESGTYPDLAWAAGTDLLGDTVQATAGDPEFFVGTQVAVIRPGVVEGASVHIDTDRDVTHKHKKVKHKTRILPATGVSYWWFVAIIVLILIGSGFIRAGRKKKKNGNPPNSEPEDTNHDSFGTAVVIGLIGLSLLFGARATQAAIPTLAADMMTPKSPYQTTDFNLGFVALDINNNPITVECFLNGSATPYDTINLPGGGTSGNCHVTSSVIPGDGTYQFHIVATNGAETVTSPDVSLEVITGGPGTPTNYNRDKISSCDYTITFVTANDGGKTVKVELYRSTQRDFVADATTKIDELAIGSSQAGSFTTTRPDCGQTYYYAIRAFDALGNGSGVVGDTRTVHVTTGGGTRTVTTTVTSGGGAIPVEGAVAGASQGAGATGGEVAGEQAPSPSGEEQPGQVQGAETGKAQNFFQRHKIGSIIAALIALALLYYLYAKTRKKGNLALPKDNPPADNPPAETPPTDTPPAGPEA